MGLIPAVIGFLIAPYVFPVVFGAEWSTAGHYAQLLALTYFSSLLMGPVNSALVLIGKLRFQLWWEAVRFLMLASVWAAAITADWHAEAALLGYAAVCIAVNIAFIAIARIQLTIAATDARNGRIEVID
jgi:O-antigen/teichoic acid export membrane protein